MKSPIYNCFPAKYCFHDTFFPAFALRDQPIVAEFYTFHNIDSLCTLDTTRDSCGYTTQTSTSRDHRERPFALRCFVCQQIPSRSLHVILCRVTLTLKVARNHRISFRSMLFALQKPHFLRAAVHCCSGFVSFLVLLPYTIRC